MDKGTFKIPDSTTGFLISNKTMEQSLSGLCNNDSPKHRWACIWYKMHRWARVWYKMHTSHFSVIAGRSVRSWSDWEIKIFLQEWEVVKQEVGLPEREIHRKSRAVSQRLYHRGLTKSWRSWFLLLLTLQDLYRICVMRYQGADPCFCLI